MADLSLPALRMRGLVDERSMLRRMDFMLVLAVLALSGVGLAMVYSATNGTLRELGQDPGFYLKRQLLFVGVGVVVMAAAMALDYRVLRMWVPVGYVFAVLALMAVQTPLGTSVKGAQRWFEIGPFQLSPSLFARVALVAMLAHILADIKGEPGLRHVIRATLVSAVPMALVFIQPDIGTTIILAFILVVLLVVSGAKVRHLAVLGAVAALATFGAFQMHIIKDYQLERLISFLNPAADVQVAGYNRHQAEIAIGAGGIWGRGYLQGTQTSLDYVPEQHTDFIFTVVAEELGFARGAIPLLLLFGVVLWRLLRVAQAAADPYGTLLAAGVAGCIAVQIFVNVGMTVGIMPITGIPLPFISYGGSALIADLAAIGLVMNVNMRRFL